MQSPEPAEMDEFVQSQEEQLTASLGLPKEVISPSGHQEEIENEGSIEKEPLGVEELYEMDIVWLACSMSPTEFPTGKHLRTARRKLDRARKKGKWDVNKARKRHEQ
jgi:hypothetical protein